MIQKLIFTILTLIVSNQLSAQDLIFSSFQQYCTCDSQLFSEIKSDSILNISIIRDDVLSIDLVSQSTCYTKHLGGIKYENNTLSLLFSHESTESPAGFDLIGYKPSKIIEVADCKTNYLFGFTLNGMSEIPKTIELNGKKLKVPEITQGQRKSRKLLDEHP